MAMSALGPATAEAATYCVRVEAASCGAQRATAEAAFEAAATSEGADTILLGRITEAGTFADAAGEPVHVAGAGRGATVLDGGLDLTQAGSTASGLTVRAPAGALIGLSGTGADLALSGAVRLRGGSELRSSTIDGAVTTAGAARIESVAVSGPGIDVASGTLTAAHLTLSGSGAAGVRIAAAASATVAGSVVWGFAAGIAGRAEVRSSLLPEQGLDPGFEAPPGDLRPRAGSPLVDAGDPSPLTQTEPHEDAAGEVRAMDGDGDGTARRDIGAYERRPPLPAAARGNLLENPGAEQGDAADDDAKSFRPPGWIRTGGFTAVRYGTVAGAAPFPPLTVAEALNAGRAFFAAGPSGPSTLVQEVDVSAWAPEIDGRAGRMRLSALLGGYRTSPDAADVAAEFLDPAGNRLGSVSLDAVTPADRAGATMLLARVADAVLPRLTRTVAVTLRAGTPGGRYNDAYADDVALVPSIRRLRGVPRRDASPARRRRAYSGAAVLSARAGVDRKRRAWVRLACPTAARHHCGGVVTITARLPRAERETVAGSTVFRLAPGGTRHVAVPLFRRARRAFPARRRARPVRLHGHVFTSSRDRGGTARSMTAPLRLERPRRG